MTLLPLALAALLTQTAPAPAEVEAGGSAAASADASDGAAASPLFKLALAHLAKGDAKAAAKPLERLLQQEPESVDVLVLLARAYRGAAEPEKAAVLLDRAIERQPREGALHAERALVALSVDQPATAVASFKKAVELEPDDADLAFNLAVALHRMGDRLDEAIGGYRRALALRPTHVAAKVNLAKALSEKGLRGEAKALLVEAATSDAADTDAHYNLGVVLLRENDAKGAMQAFQRALKLSPRHGPSLNNLGVAQEALGDPKRAVESFKLATAADPTSAEAPFNLGLALLKLGRSIDAAKAFETALKREPQSSGPYVQLGSIYLKDGRPDRAVEAFKKAVAALDAKEKESSVFRLLRNRFDAERTTDAYRGLALAYLALGRPDDAVAALALAVDKLPRDASARAALGDALIAKGDTAGAIVQLKERLALEPTTEARLALARAYAKHRSAKEAEPLYRNILDGEPGQRQAMLGLADLYLDMGRFADGETVLKELIAADAGDAQALGKLGILKSRLGRPNEALEPLARAVELNPLIFDARAEHGLLLYRIDPEANAEGCVRTMGEILALEPRHALSLYYRGVCQFARGRAQEAEASFKAAVGADPRLATAHYSLGEFYEGQGKLDEAREAYTTAAQLGHVEASQALKKLGGGAASKAGAGAGAGSAAGSGAGRARGDAGA